MALRSYFDAIYLSSDAGICKPQPEFLKQVLDDYGLNRLRLSWLEMT